MAHPSVLEAAVVAIAHPEYGKRPLAVIVKKADREITAEALQQFIELRFAHWQIPHDWVFVEALPKTSTGKFMKHKLRADFSDYVSKTPSRWKPTRSGRGYNFQCRHSGDREHDGAAKMSDCHFIPPSQRSVAFE
jgi:hypothetical protein